MSCHPIALSGAAGENIHKWTLRKACMSRTVCQEADWLWVPVRLRVWRVLRHSQPSTSAAATATLSLECLRSQPLGARWCKYYQLVRSIQCYPSAGSNWPLCVAAWQQGFGGAGKVPSSSLWKSWTPATVIKSFNSKRGTHTNGCIQLLRFNVTHSPIWS